MGERRGWMSKQRLNFAEAHKRFTFNPKDGVKPFPDFQGTKAGDFLFWKDHSVCGVDLKGKLQAERQPGGSSVKQRRRGGNVGESETGRGLEEPAGFMRDEGGRTDQGWG